LPADGEALRRVAMRLVPLAREHAAPELCWDALCRLPPALSERGALLDAREWALRELGRVDEERARLHVALLADPHASLIERLHRLDSDVELTMRTLGEWLHAGELSKNSSRALSTSIAELAMDFARRHASDRLAPTLLAL